MVLKQLAVYLKRNESIKKFGNRRSSTKLEVYIIFTHKLAEKSLNRLILA